MSYWQKCVCTKVAINGKYQHLGQFCFELNVRVPSCTFICCYRSSQCMTNHTKNVKSALYANKCGC